MKKKQILITTGDIDGIGAEVTAKALLDLNTSLHDTDLFIFRSNQNQPEFEVLNKHCNVIQSSQLSLAIDKAYSSPSPSLHFISNDSPPPFWVKEAAEYCMMNPDIASLVTGPLSKSLIVQSGLHFMGHTEILKSICGVSHLFMAFVGPLFSTLIVTGHISLNKVSQQLTAELLTCALKEALNLRALLNSSNKPIALLGLNPHAGENGLIGDEEIQVIQKALDIFNNDEIVGPLVPDAAFLPENLLKYGVFVALYHDQALIPFKALHGHDHGVHITMGLPFLRTSVNHGTAKEIFRQNKANPQSMKEAIRFALNH